MNIVVLTVEERLYLPAFFARLFAARGRDIRAVFMAPLRHGHQSTLNMICKYCRTFGTWNTLKLARREITARVADKCYRRGRGERFHSTTAVARRHGIACEVVENVNAPEFHSRLREMQTDLIISVACPQIFKRALIELPPKGCLNMHGAKLPHYRGLAPSFWMMADGETEAGVTIFLVNEDIDAGEVVEQDIFPILPHETLEEFIVRSKDLSCGTMLRAIDKIEQGGFSTRPLDKNAGSYFGWPTRADYQRFLAQGRRIW